MNITWFRWLVKPNVLNVLDQHKNQTNAMFVIIGYLSFAGQHLWATQTRDYRQLKGVPRTVPWFQKPKWETDQTEIVDATEDEEKLITGSFKFPKWFLQIFTVPNIIVKLTLRLQKYQRRSTNRLPKTRLADCLPSYTLPASSSKSRRATLWSFKDTGLHSPVRKSSWKKYCWLAVRILRWLAGRYSIESWWR